MDYQTVGSLQTYGGGLLTTTGVSVPQLNLTQPNTGVSGGSGAILNQAGDLLTGGIFSSVLSAISNLSNIGASTNPTRESNNNRPFIQSTLQSKLAGLNDKNIGETLSWIDGFLNYNKTAYQHLLDHHARANSTKEAYRNEISFLKQVIIQVVDNYISELKKQGYKVSQSTVTKPFLELQNKVYEYYNGGTFDSQHGYNVTYRNFNVVAPTIVDTVKTTVDDAGNVIQTVVDKQESSMGGLFIAVAGGWLFNKIFKIF